MPIDYKKYAEDWQSIRANILKRAGNKCEFCGLDNHMIVRSVKRNGGTDWFRHEDKYMFGDEWGEGKDVKVVLTIAHLDHDVTNNDEDNLRALCQLHHLQYDAAHHAKTRRDKKK